MHDKNITSIFFILFVINYTEGLRCYKGQQTGVAGFNKIREIETCNKSYCYNATSTVGGILNFIKSGCGEKRCLATQLPKIPTFLSKLNISILKGYDEITRTGCYHTDIDGKPVELCCCQNDLCNSGMNNSKGYFNTLFIIIFLYIFLSITEK